MDSTIVTTETLDEIAAFAGLGEVAAPRMVLTVKAEDGEVIARSAPAPRERVLDTNGAGDVFHGAYLAAYLANPKGRWSEHLSFARAASAWKIQHLGNEAGLPSQANVADMIRLYA